MPFNPSPKVAELRDYAERFKVPMVVILEIGPDGIGYSSYGETRALCDEAQRIADVAHDAVVAWFEEQE